MKISNEEILLINALHSISGVTAKDCFQENGRVIFLVKGDLMGAVIGKKGSKIREVSKKLRKQVEVFPYAEKPDEFVRLALKGVKTEKIEVREDNGRKSLEVSCDAESRNKLKHEGRTLKRVKQILERNYKINDLRFR